MPDLIFNRFGANLLNKIVDLEADTIKIALLADTYTPNKDHNVLADVSAHQISGTGYTAGGATLANVAVSQDDTNDRVKLDADDVVWSNSTLTARYAVIYDDTLANKDLIMLIDFGQNYSSTNGPFTISFHATNGIMLLSQGA